MEEKAEQNHLAMHVQLALQKLLWTECEIVDLTAAGAPVLIIKGRDPRNELEFVLPVMPTSTLSATKAQSLFSALGVSVGCPVASVLFAISSANGALTFYRISNSLVDSQPHPRLGTDKKN